MKIFTREEIQSMTPEEINANWDEIKSSMAAHYAEHQNEREGIVKALWEAWEKKNEPCNT